MFFKILGFFTVICPVVSVLRDSIFSFRVATQQLHQAREKLDYFVQLNEEFQQEVLGAEREIEQALSELDEIGEYTFVSSTKDPSGDDRLTTAEKRVSDLLSTIGHRNKYHELISTAQAEYQGAVVQEQLARERLSAETQDDANEQDEDLAEAFQILLNL
jgi:hypothetical protein